MELFAIYVDILGFGSELIEKNAKEIALSPEEVREAWLKRINNAIEYAKESNLISSFKEMSSDSWAIFTKELDNLYKMLGILSGINLPLEIAIHFDDFPEINPTLSDQMMSFLKNNILGKYRFWFKGENNESIKESFILVTQEACSLLKACKKPHHDAEYYLFDLTTVPQISIEKIQKPRVTLSKESEEFLSKRKKEWLEFANHNLWVIGSLTPLDLLEDKINPTDQNVKDVINNVKLLRKFSINSGDVNPYHTKPKGNGSLMSLINEDLREIKKGIGHRVQIFANGYCEFLICLELSTKRITQYISERDPEEYKGQKIIHYKWFSECFLKQIEGLKKIWEESLPFNNMSLRIFVARTKDTCLFSEDGITLARSTIGDLIESDFLEYDKIINKTDDKNRILDLLLKQFVNYFGLHLDRVQDDNGKFIEPSYLCWQ